MTYILVAAALIGAVIGSFLNVCIHRLPRGGSLVRPASQCPACGAPIRFYDNVPILSFLILGGRCRSCKTGISLRYPMVEALNALAYTGIVLRYGPGWHTPALWAFCSAMIVITFIDLDFQIIPDAITLPGILVGLAASATVLPDPFAHDAMLGFRDGMIGFLAGGSLFYIVAVLSRGGMGGGDIKMMAMVGSFLGWKAVLLTTFAGSLIGSVAGIFLMAFRGKGRKTKIPFGPFLALGAVISVFAGREILVLYLGR